MKKQKKIKQQDCKDNKQAVVLYKHVKGLSQLKYESELRREDSLISQSSQMQTAFSFMTATVFMALPVIIDNRNNAISLRFILVATSSILMMLFVSLLFASQAQSRSKRVALDNISKIEKHISDNWESVLLESQQLKHWVEALKVVQEDLSKINDKRANYIRYSMICFKISVFLIAFWFIVAVIKIV